MLGDFPPKNQLIVIKIQSKLMYFDTQYLGSIKKRIFILQILLDNIYKMICHPSQNNKSIF